MENSIVNIILGLVAGYFVLMFLIAKMKNKTFEEFMPEATGWFIAKLLQGVVFLVILLIGLFILFLLVKFIKWAWFV